MAPGKVLFSPLLQCDIDMCVDDHSHTWHVGGCVYPGEVLGTRRDSNQAICTCIIEIHQRAIHLTSLS